CRCGALRFRRLTTSPLLPTSQRTSGRTGGSLAPRREYSLHDALVEHRVGDLHEAADVGAVDVVDRAVALLAVAHAGLVDLLHDELQALVDLLADPGEAHGVLRHLQAGDGDAAGVGRLAGREEDAGVDELRHRLRIGGHVRALRHTNAAACEQRLGVGAGDLVLGGARHRDVATHRPRALPVDVLGPGVRIDVLAHAAAAGVLELHHPGELLPVDAALVDDGARRVGEGDHLGAQLQQLLHRELRHVARARHRDALATQVLA